MKNLEFQFEEKLSLKTLSRIQTRNFSYFLVEWKLSKVYIFCAFREPPTSKAFCFNSLFPQDMTFNIHN